MLKTAKQIYQDKTLKLFISLSKTLLIDRKFIRKYELKEYSLQQANLRYNARKKQHNNLLKRLAELLNIKQITLDKYLEV